VAATLNNLAQVYEAQGQYARAEPLYQEALAICKKAFDPKHPDLATVMENYAELLANLKRDRESADLREQAKETRAKR
jgi:tetratricopeptide (TPR) repeat protein